MGDLRDSLQKEYEILQAQYEIFDQRALTIKSWAAALLATGVGVGFHERSVAILLSTALAAGCLWYLEAVWKTFQYSYTDRIRLIESWFRNGTGDIAPFQIFSSWAEAWDRWAGKPEAALRLMWMRFVMIPYLPIIAIAVVAASTISLWSPVGDPKP